MKYLDEYRDDDVARALLDDIARIATKPWTIMEVCGGQTHTLIRQGIDQLLPNEVELVHGPGCPVCVTPVAMIDEAIAIAKRPDTILCSFGDMLRVPGSTEDLFHAAGGRRRRARRLLAARRAGGRAAEPRQDRGVLRRRVRDDRARERDGRFARPSCSA